MNRNLHPCAPLYRKLVLLTALCGVVGSIFLYLAYRFAFDAEIQHFVYDAPVWVVSCIAYIAGFLLVVATVLLMRKKVSFARELPEGLGEVFFSYFAAVLFAIVFLRKITQLPAIEDTNLLSLIAAYTSIFPALYFLISGLHKKNPVVSAVLALCGAGSVVFSMFEQYFDLSIPLNSPVRVFSVITTSGLLLFFLSEVRLQIFSERSTVGSFHLANGNVGLFLTSIGLAQAIFALTDPHRTFDFLPQAAIIAVGALAFCRMYRAYSCFGYYKAPEEYSE